MYDVCVKVRILFCMIRSEFSKVGLITKVLKYFEQGENSDELSTHNQQ